MTDGMNDWKGKFAFGKVFAIAFSRSHLMIHQRYPPSSYLMIQAYRRGSEIFVVVLDLEDQP